MGHQKHLFKKGENFYFRRRIPGLSTTFAPVLVSMGTKSENFAHTWLLKLTMEFEDMLDTFLYVPDELPENLIASYTRVRLKHAIMDLRRQHRMERMTGRVSSTLPNNVNAQRLALETLLQDGIQKTFPHDRICPNWTEDELEAVM